VVRGEEQAPGFAKADASCANVRKQMHSITIRAPRLALRVLNRLGPTGMFDGGEPFFIRDKPGATTLMAEFS
jgi:hypothetical protein